MRTIISTAALVAMTTSASAMCLGTACQGYGSSNLIYTPPPVVQQDVHVHVRPSAPEHDVYLPPPPPTVVLPCRKTPRTDAEKIGAFFSALGGVVENECDPADIRREQEAHAARLQLMEEQRRLMEAQRRALQAQARPVQELPKPDRKLCRDELANPSRATRHLQVECMRLYGEKP
jgi:hypothetical protein